MLSSNLSELLQDKIDKANQRRKHIVEENKRLEKNWKQ
jgi:hypothetical protein